ncbi:hypothetical protein BJI67_13140 [Acidihalobacter aeolianus]|uniref:DUF7847 domain-containing protein n=1 Tax=Acidihalobacter aeolianus TaxID=2792603 RepID=A0A1D8KA99_9GAMM|nr:BPSS1780 family membrane protein [Acidihalobacter aeolianus]AOV17875.1 hypothetical protein BJI67_13140 [Acidihalobacter aeolianus]
MHEIRRLGAGHGLEWVTTGWDIFRREPGMFVLLFLVFILISFLVGLLPLVGTLLTLLITPALTGGLLLAVETASRGKSPSFENLFAGLTDTSRRNRMLTLGLWTLIANVLVWLVAMLLGGSFIMSLMGFGAMGAGHMGGMALAGAGAGIGLSALLLALLLYVIYASALFFATPLVMLAGMEPLAALKLSLRANLYNIGAWVIFALVYLALVVIALIPAGLGLLIVGPMSIASAYCAYLDTFTNLPGKVDPAAGDALPNGKAE